MLSSFELLAIEGCVYCYYISFVQCLLTAFYWVVLLHILNPSPPSNTCFPSFFSQHDLPFHFLTMCLMSKRFSFHQVQLIVFFSLMTHGFCFLNKYLYILKLQNFSCVFSSGSFIVSVAKFRPMMATWKEEIILKYSSYNYADTYSMSFSII